MSNPPLLDRLLNPASLAAAELRAGERVLDLGCGEGFLSRAFVARGCSVLAIDAAADTLQRARDQATAGLEFRLGRAPGLPLADGEWGSFDLCHARFLLESCADPQMVVDELVRCLRPGGRLILEDDDHRTLRMWPVPARVMRLWQAYMVFFDSTGRHSAIGGRLDELLRAAGAVAIETREIHYGARQGDADFLPCVGRLRGILELAAPGMQEMGLVGPDDLQAADVELLAWSRGAEAELRNQLCWAQGRLGS